MQEDDEKKEAEIVRYHSKEDEEPIEAVQHPAKLLRIASMIRLLLEEVRHAPLDDSGRKRLAEIYESSLTELKGVLSEGLQRELDALAFPLQGTPSESEIRVAQAQLVGWLEGLLHGIQAALWAQHMQARAQLEEMRRRGLPQRSGESDEPFRSGQYL
jgi:hypothetical protein